MRKISITTSEGKISIQETDILGNIKLSRDYNDNSNLKVIPNNHNQFFKDIGQITYQIVDNYGKALNVPCLLSEFEIDSVVVTDVTDFNTITAFSSGSSGTGIYA